MAAKSKTAQIAKIVNKSLNSNDEKIINLLQEKKEAYTTDLAEKLGVNLSTINRRTSLLQNEGILVKYKKNNKMVVKWLGGVPAIEQELISASNKHIAASLLAENYDLMIINPFSIFELLFENNYWEIIMNLKEGLTDDELKSYLGNSINLDSIRRILVTCDAHNIIKLNMIREPAENDIVKLYEPLYRIDKVNKEFLEYLILIRGLASAMSMRIEGHTNKNYSHLYDSILDVIAPMFFALKEKSVSNTNEVDNEILKNVILNYDTAGNMDRLYRPANWRKMLNQTNNIIINEKSDNIIITKGLSEDYKKSILGRVTKK